MRDYKHLYNKEPKVSGWAMLRDGLLFAWFLVMAFIFILALSAV